MAFRSDNIKTTGGTGGQPVTTDFVPLRGNLWHIIALKDLNKDAFMVPVGRSQVILTWEINVTKD